MQILKTSLTFSSGSKALEAQAAAAGNWTLAWSHDAVVAGVSAPPAVVGIGVM